MIRVRAEVAKNTRNAADDRRYAAVSLIRFFDGVQEPYFF